MKTYPSPGQTAARMSITPQGLPGFTRRQFLQLTAAAATGASAGLFSGCSAGVSLPRQAPPNPFVENGRPLLDKHKRKTALLDWPEELSFLDIDLRADYERLKQLA